LIDIKHFNESYNVWEFVSDCNKVIEKILSKNKVPIIVGGTNLYVKALIENYHFDNIKRDNNLREKLNTIAEISGLNVLYEMLKKQNPAKAKKISSNDKYRILRALECSTLQDNESENAKYLNEKPRYDYKLYALNLPREKLYELINKRVDLMIGNGLLDEVKDLKNKGLNLEMQAGKSIGYREFLEYLDGKITYEYAVEKIKQHSRNYAKRQYTWLNSMENIIWLDALDKEKAVEIIIQNESLI
jgi:tRNA dimethylallyltransferase